MNAMADAILLQALRQPDAVRRFSLPQWELLVRQARHSDLLARLAVRLEQAGVWAQGQGERQSPVPVQAQAHLRAAQLVVAAQHAEVGREVRAIMHALAPLDIPVVLLKGAAYVLAGLPSAAGRSMSDIDLLVPRAAVSEVESRLMLSGWMSSHPDPYDQRYYREWMHEIPPMRHLTRGVTLDVHHGILPLTARFKPDSALLLQAAQPLPSTSTAQAPLHPRLRVLSAVDMILHSMTHLLHNEELAHGLRDLTDLDLLLRHHAAEAGFWLALLQRAMQLDLQRPLAHGLRLVHGLLHTPVPADVQAQAHAQARMGAFNRWCSDAMWGRGLSCLHSTARRPGTALALGAVYLRAHWMRMPAPLLVRHLGTKALRALKEEPKPQAA